MSKADQVDTPVIVEEAELAQPLESVAVDTPEDEADDQDGIWGRKVSRRAILEGTPRVILLVALAKLGVLSARTALAQEKGTGTDVKEHAEDLAHDSLSLTTLDIVGSLGFVDAIVAIARGKDSVVQKLCVLAGLPTYNTGELDPNSHKSKFPLENIHLALILNIIRASSFGEEVRHHTIHEFFTTLKGVGLLMGLTSMAKGITAVESSAEKMTHTDPEKIVTDPEKTIADSIFQLTAIATATQLPLTAFGNASIGNHEFGEVRSAFTSIYTSLLPNPVASGEIEPTEDEIRQHISSAVEGKSNEQVKKRTQKILARTDLHSWSDFNGALLEESKAHTNDLMTLLMSTSCDDAQAAAGDAGPLVGLYQSYGSDFVKAIPAILPYTMLIGVERAIWAADRAGIPKSEILTAERFRYMGQFLAATWKNLIIYFATVAPQISSRIGDTGGIEIKKNGNGVGRDFSLIEQIARDVESVGGTVVNAILGSFNGDTLDIRKVKKSIKKIKDAQANYYKELGRKLEEKVEEEGPLTEDDSIPVRKDGLQEIHERVVGKKSTHQELAELQAKIEELSIDQNAEAIEAFAATLKTYREQLGGELKEALAQLKEESGGETPSIAAVAALLKDNPKVRDLLDFNYWHHTIGPELTDTMFVVFLQGLHLPFIISTIEKFVYNSESFKKMPLMAQEWCSVFLNDVVSMFADNWADCVAHSKWLTTMYFNELHKSVDVLSERYPEVEGKISGKFFEDDSTKIIPERFAKRKQQFAALIQHLKQQHPEDAAELDVMLLDFMERSEKYYWKSMIMAMVAAVTGGGKAKTGNAPHFTFAANEDDFTLAETLNDFKRHPIYHLWEFIFSTGYATTIGPALAQVAFGKDMAIEMQQMLQERFREQFPEFEKKLGELKSKETADASTPGETRMASRRSFLSLGKLFG